MDDETRSSLDEEIRIMDERACDEPSFSADSFQLAISNLATDSVQTIDASASVAACVALMQRSRSSAVLVTEGGRLAGIFTEHDLVQRVLERESAWQDRCVADFMTPRPEALCHEDPIVFVMNRMYVGGYRHVPIVDDDGAPTRIVSIRDVLRFILDSFERHVSNIPPDPYRGPPSQWSE